MRNMFARLRISIFSFLTLFAVTQALAQSITSNSPVANDCMICHSENRKVVGPSWSQIRERYTQADTEYLVQSVLNGGSPKWGAFPMPKSTMSKTDIETLITALNLPRGNQDTSSANSTTASNSPPATQSTSTASSDNNNEALSASCTAETNRLLSSSTKCAAVEGSIKDLVRGIKA
jgi:cytochrome c551/c552